MPTLAGLRRRGYTPGGDPRASASASASPSATASVDVALLEHAVREDLNRRAPRAMAVLRPLRVVIENYPEGQVEEFEAVNNPEDAGAGTRQVPFSRVLYIEQRRLPRGAAEEVLPPGARPRGAAALRVLRHVHRRGEGRARRGRRAALHLRSRRRAAAMRRDGRKVKATLHWVSAAARASRPRCALYDRLFTVENPSAEKDGTDFTTLPQPGVARACCRRQGRAEPRRRADPGARLQFERLGYFCVDADSTPAGRARSSTARSRCGTAGRRSRRAGGSREESGSR